MLIRGQTTEDRIRKIAEGFSQGLQGYANYANTQAKSLTDEKRYQEAKTLQDEARKRQEAIQALEISNNIANQTGKYIDPGQVAPLLKTGSLSGIGDLLKTAPSTRKAELEAQDRERKLRQDELDGRYKQSQIDKNNNTIKAPPLSYEEKIRTKQRLDQENEVNKKPTTDQRKVATFYSRVDQAEKDFQKLSEAGYNRASFEESAKAMLPNAVKSENLKKQEQAERNFINAVLRRESGAAIADSEFKSAELQYFPRVGDTPEVIEQKRKNREIVMAGLRAEAGDRAVDEIQTQLGNQNPPSLKPGLVEDGYQYLGGDPASPESWKKV